MARSLARTAGPLLVGTAGRSVAGSRFRRDRAQAAAELVDARVHPGARTVAQDARRRCRPRSPRARRSGTALDAHPALCPARARGAVSQRARIGCDPVAQSEPSDQCSFFQIGTLAFTRSMHASRRGERLGAVRARDDDRDRGLREREPTEAVHDRDAVDRGPLVAHRGDDLARAGAARVRRTPRRSSATTSSRPSAWSRTTPRNATTAPMPGVVAHATSGSSGDRLVDEREPVTRVGNRRGQGHGGHCRNAVEPDGPSSRAERGCGRARGHCERTASLHSRRERWAAETRFAPVSVPPIDDGGAGDDEPTLGGPPHPMDRIWRHPSELPSRRRSTGPRPCPALIDAAALAARAARRRGRRRAADRRGARGCGRLRPADRRPAPTTRPTVAGHTNDAISAVATRVAPAIVAVRVLGEVGLADRFGRLHPPRRPGAHERPPHRRRRAASSSSPRTARSGPPT